jgi:hypothetical protein
MAGELDRVCRRLRAAVNGDVEPVTGGRDERLGDLLPFREREQDSLSRRPEREDAVEAAAGEEVDIRRDRLGVDRSSALAEGRHGCGDPSLQHAPTLRSRR